MKYKDDLSKGYANGYYVGKSDGARLVDGLAPTSDGLDHVRSYEHEGTVLQDGAEPGYPEPLGEGTEEEE